MIITIMIIMIDYFDLLLQCSIIVTISILLL